MKLIGTLKGEYERINTGPFFFSHISFVISQLSSAARVGGWIDLLQ